MEIIDRSKVGQLIKNNDQLMVGGFIGTGVPEEILCSLQKYYLDNQKPKDLSLIFCAGQGDGKERGLNHLAQEGMVKKVIGGHFGLSPKINKLINDNLIEGYNLPQGIMSQLTRASAAKVPYIVSKVGLNTFVDPRIEGGKLNKISKENIIELVKEDNQDLLKYKTFRPNVALLRGTYADKKGNISFKNEGLTLDSLSMAQAAKNNHGIVIVQVEEVVDYLFDPKEVKIPYILVDYVLVCEQMDNHMQTFNTLYDKSFIENKDVVNKQEPYQLNDRKVIARRAAMELTKEDRVLNYGIGIPEIVANVLNEEKQEHYFTPTVEPGIIGGTPQGGLDFGVSKYPDMILDQAAQFDYYDGGGIDCAFLGLAQADQLGNINVSKFGPKIAGAGGFINISQNAKKVVFCGTFMAGSKTKIVDNKLVIEKEGVTQKFISEVEQITFSGKYAIENDLDVVYISERAVFKIDTKTQRLMICEIAPGIDLEKDVLSLMSFKPEISEDLKVMDTRIFNEKEMGLSF